MVESSMARSTYIYHVRSKRQLVLLGSFTVKREAREWVARKGWHIDDLQLSRMRDGLDMSDPIGKHEEVIEWPSL